MKRLLIFFLIINIQDTWCGGVFSSLSAQTSQNQEDDSHNPPLESFSSSDLIAEWETDEGVRHTVNYLCSTDNTINGLKFKIDHSSTFAGRSTGCDYSLEWHDERADFARQNDALVRKMQGVNNLTELMILRRLASHSVFNR